jgi:hypothetical protein
MTLRPRCNRPVRILSVVLVALCYPALVGLHGVCDFEHAGGSDRSSHHSPSAGPSEIPSHHVFCAWVCQATSDAVVFLPSPMASSGPVVRQAALSPHEAGAGASISAVHSRAPPSMLFVGALG